MKFLLFFMLFNYRINFVEVSKKVGDLRRPAEIVLPVQEIEHRILAGFFLVGDWQMNEDGPAIFVDFGVQINRLEDLRLRCLQRQQDSAQQNRNPVN